MALSFCICALEDQCSRGSRLMVLLLRSRFLPSVTLGFDLYYCMINTFLIKLCLFWCDFNTLVLLCLDWLPLSQVLVKVTLSLLQLRGDGISVLLAIKILKIRKSEGRCTVL